MRIEKLSPHVGAEVKDVDIGSKLSAPTVEGIHQALVDHGMLLFRGQVLEPQSLIDFSAHFGELKPHVQKKFHVPGFPLVVFNTNVDENGNFDEGAARRGVHETTKMNWHSDQSYDQVPSRATIVCPIELPSRGGDTLFKNTYQAYDSMPEDLKRRALGKRGVFGYVTGQGHAANVARSHLTSDAADNPEVTHPLVRTNAVTKRKCVYVNGICCSGVVGLEPAQANELIDDILEWVDRPEFIYRHQWILGDVIMWDNRGGVFHTGKLDYPLNERRRMYRTTVGSGPGDFCDD
ncbi:MAG: TauD/TfdA family dioxygenase [Gammaproteobacteria bacterium]|nr:TauD/TfdA family dioxygenase [Gammaproteobacteria bacterium]